MTSNKELSPLPMSRRHFLSLTSKMALAAAIPPSPADLLLRKTDEQGKTNTTLTHDVALALVQEHSMTFGSDFLKNAQEDLMAISASCVQQEKRWVVPSHAYRQMYTRDTFWITTSVMESQLLTNFLDHMRQAQRPDGQIPTFLPEHVGWDTQPVFHADESTLLYILTEYIASEKGIPTDTRALQRATQYVIDHIHDGKYLTDPLASEPQSYQYWIDSTVCVPNRAITYVQGLTAVALEALSRMGILCSSSLAQRVGDRYKLLTLPDEPGVLAQQDGVNVLEPSSLVGEALSLYLFDHSLIGTNTAESTIKRLVQSSSAIDNDGKFLGFKALCRTDGSYLPASNFIPGSESAHAGSYHNGGSWFLYDMLTLYVGARHGLTHCGVLMTERIASDRSSYPLYSFEVLRTHPQNLTRDAIRARYGWNGFVARLLLPKKTQFQDADLAPYPIPNNFDMTSSRFL